MSGQQACKECWDFSKKQQLLYGKDPGCIMVLACVWVCCRPPPSLSVHLSQGLIYYAEGRPLGRRRTLALSVCVLACVRARLCVFWNWGWQRCFPCDAHIKTLCLSHTYTHTHSWLSFVSPRCMLRQRGMGGLCLKMISLNVFWWL